MPSRPAAARWVEGVEATEESLLGSGDIQSLADLGNSYQGLKKLRAVPIELGDFVAMAIPGILPALPLALTVMPLKENPDGPPPPPRVNPQGIAAPP